MARFGTGIPHGGVPSSRSMQPTRTHSPAHMAGGMLRGLGHTEEAFKKFWENAPEDFKEKLKDALEELGGKALKLFFQVATNGGMVPSDDQIKNLMGIGKEKAKIYIKGKYNKAKGILDLMANGQPHHINNITNASPELGALCQEIQRHPSLMPQQPIPQVYAGGGYGGMPMHPAAWQQQQQQQPMPPAVGGAGFGGSATAAQQWSHMGGGGTGGNESTNLIAIHPSIPLHNTGMLDPETQLSIVSSSFNGGETQTYLVPLGRTDQNDNQVYKNVTKEVTAELQAMQQQQQGGAGFGDATGIPPQQGGGGAREQDQTEDLAARLRNL